MTLWPLSRLAVTKAAVVADHRPGLVPDEPYPQTGTSRSPTADRRPVADWPGCRPSRRPAGQPPRCRRVRRRGTRKGRSGLLDSVRTTSLSTVHTFIAPAQTPVPQSAFTAALAWRRVLWGSPSVVVRSAPATLLRTVHTRVPRTARKFTRSSRPKFSRINLQRRPSFLPAVCAGALNGSTSTTSCVHPRRLWPLFGKDDTTGVIAS
jgi:hypothetical protein